MGLSVGALLAFSGTALLNTAHLKSQRAFEYAADGATDAAVQWVRYRPNAYNSGAANCLPNGATSLTINSYAMAVVCSGTLNSLSAKTRTVTFYACGTNQGTCASANAVLVAVLVFDDYSTSGANGCNQTTSATCGTGTTVEQWVVQTASH